MCVEGVASDRRVWSSLLRRRRLKTEEDGGAEAFLERRQRRQVPRLFWSAKCNARPRPDRSVSGSSIYWTQNMLWNNYKFVQNALLHRTFLSKHDFWDLMKLKERASSEEGGKGLKRRREEEERKRRRGGGGVIRRRIYRCGVAAHLKRSQYLLSNK